ncbi:hypothetical protein BRADI_2g49085v3 [Brachypodium distachyon]|uniref:No apical meristem-associated C-terminal domain-containing protein n=1 Tax=Brachypodium distachyon TaxID=15368 RepID=A0A2K2DEW7_BRADI|nr:hypothetical protein BRADI_2g49085v3 [Brachypodium distachyon]
MAYAKCEAWLEIGQDPICGAEQKGQAYWKPIYDFFHEQPECNKFAGTHDHVKARRLSGVGVQDVSYQALDYFKVLHKKPFSLINCWQILKEAPKWPELYISTKKSPSNGKKRDDITIDLEASGHTEAATRAVRPRGRTNSKGEAKREASNLTFEETLKKIWLEKEA